LRKRGKGRRGVCLFREGKEYKSRSLLLGEGGMAFFLGERVRNKRKKKNSIAGKRGITPTQPSHEGDDHIEKKKYFV